MNAVESLRTYHGKGWIWTGLIRDSRMWMCWGRERAFQLEETEAWGVGLGQGRMWSAALCSGKSLQACRECLLLFLDLFGCCFWQPWVSLLHSWAFSSCGERGLLFIVVLGPLSGSFSCCGARECVCVCVCGGAPVDMAHGLVVPRHVGSSWTGDWTQAPCLGRRILYHWTPREAWELHP